MAVSLAAFRQRNDAQAAQAQNSYTYSNHAEITQPRRLWAGFRVIWPWLSGGGSFVGRWLISNDGLMTGMTGLVKILENPSLCNLMIFLYIWQVWRVWQVYSTHTHEIFFTLVSKKRVFAIELFLPQTRHTCHCLIYQWLTKMAFWRNPLINNEMTEWRVCFCKRVIFENDGFVMGRMTGLSWPWTQKSRELARLLVVDGWLEGNVWEVVIW